MIYFDNGATTFPKPLSVVSAASDALRNSANPGRGAHSLSVSASERIFKCRSAAAEFFGVENPENIIFTDSCTTALNTVIKGVLKKGDHAVISSLEHNAVLRPMEFMRSRGVDYSIARVVPYDDEATIDSFRKLLRENTRLVVCTCASNVFGLRMPVERLAAMCRMYGILFCADAAQTAGVVPYSLDNSYIDYLCAPGHKGLYGPMGTGILVINSDTVPESLLQGGTGSLSASAAQPDILPDKFESGTPNLSGIAGLAEGIKFVASRGESHIDDYELRLAARLYDRLSNTDGVTLYTERPESGKSVSVLSFNVENRDSEEVARQLADKYKIAVRAGLHCAPLAHRHFDTEEKGTVRAVPSVFNKSWQADYFADSVEKIIKSYKK